jgi:hypothetical protein
MAALQERDIGKYLFNPFSVRVNDVAGGYPLNPSFHTLPAMTFTFNKEFVAAESYNQCNGILYTVRQDQQRFDFRAGFSIQETTILTLKLTHGGTVGSTGDLLTFDGTVSNYAFWFDSCYTDSGAIIRVTVPIAKNIDSSEMASGEAHVVQPNNIQALPDIDDASTFVTIYIES